VILVCTGGRDYADGAMVEDVLDKIDPQQIFVGDCPTGADLFVRNWCKEKNKPFKVFEAAWDKYGKGAGPIRNRNMLSQAGDDCLVIAFKGGKGTEDCKNAAAKEFNYTVLEVIP
jgi:hypothetical protein